MARSRVVTSRPGKTVDFKQWTGIPSGSQDQAGNGTFAGPGILNFAVPGTILRIRGFIQISMLASGLTALDEVLLTFGLGMFSTDALAVGLTALPDPNAEPEFPWIWYGGVVMTSPNADFGDPMINQRLEVDSKAMRKFKPGQGIAVVGQYVNGAGNPGVRVSMSQIRVLIGT